MAINKDYNKGIRPVMVNGNFFLGTTLFLFGKVNETRATFGKCLFKVFVNTQESSVKLYNTGSN